MDGNCVHRRRGEGQGDIGLMDSDKLAGLYSRLDSDSRVGAVNFKRSTRSLVDGGGEENEGLCIIFLGLIERELGKGEGRRWLDGCGLRFNPQRSDEEDPRVELRFDGMVEIGGDEVGLSMKMGSGLMLGQG